MTKVVVDSYAWIEYLEDSEKGRRAAEFIENNSNEIFTSSASVAEVIGKFLKANKDIRIVINY